MWAVIRRIFSFIRPYFGFLLLALLSAAIGISLSLLIPVLIGDAVDHIVGAGAVDFSVILYLISLIAAAILFSSVFQWLMALLTNIVSQRTVRDLRIAVFSHLNRLPLRFLDRHAHGDLINRIVTDVDLISDGLLQGFTQLFTGMITILGTLFFMLSVHVGIGLLVVLITPLSLFVAAFIARRTHRLFREQSALRGELGGYVEELVGNQKMITVFDYSEQAQEKFEEINTRLYRCGAKAQFASALTNPSTRFVNGIVYASVGIAGALSAIGGGFSVGQLSCFLSYANQYTKPFNEITGVITELQTALASAKRVFDLLDEQTEPSDASVPALSECDGRVEMDRVHFSYIPEKPLLENLTLTVSPGQRIAIVGPTGCGKTTLINLLMRFYDVNSGAIRVSGCDIRSISRDSLRRCYGMVLQDTWLFSGTVRDNIAYGKPDASMDEVIGAAKAAFAHNFIMRLENGYDTVISEEGEGISQGQKQLLCIARILLTHPPMLILDEATSSIDTRTELRIQKVFAKMMEGRTSFIVAHRLSTIREADRILVMRDGNIIEQGTHDALLEADGFYAKLYRSQFEGQSQM